MYIKSLLYRQKRQNLQTLVKKKPIFFKKKNKVNQRKGNK
jgi:hypothetical protein